MTKEFYTMEENKAKEGLVNGSWGIVSDLHNYVTENQSMKYVPLGPLNTVKGKFRVEKPYKSGANGWAVPSTTEHPEDVVKLADFLASREGKLLGQYGIKGRDYTLDKKGNPHVKPEVLKEVENNPDEAKNVVLEVQVLIGQIILVIPISIIKLILVKLNTEIIQNEKLLLKRLLICGITMKTETRQNRKRTHSKIVPI